MYVTHSTTNGRNTEATVRGSGFPVSVYLGADGRRYRFVDLTGMTFGQWTVLRRVVEGVYNGRVRYVWLCTCSCGVTKGVMPQSLIQRASTRCIDCYTKAKRIPAFSQVWRDIVCRARGRKIPLSVTRDRVFRLLDEQGYRCALTGLPIKIADSHTAHNFKRETTASLDRKDSSKGYVEGNLWWVHKQVNIMKHKVPVSKFIEICRLVSAKFPALGGVT